MTSYRELERRERRPTRIVDHSAAWNRLEPLAAANGQVEERVARFCAAKRITPQSLAALGARVRTARGGRVELAFAGDNGNGAITAIKYRPLDGSSHDSYAEAPSTWLRPTIVGKFESLDWIVCEGETDGARLFELVGNVAAVMVLPAGARAFKREWAASIPRGARVALCHDADEEGDAGAEKAAKIIGGKTIRVRPPVEGGDWCDWDGGREAFLELVRARRKPRLEFDPLPLFLERHYPQAEPLLGEAGTILLARGSLFMVYGSDGSGKSTFTIDAVAHLAAGRDWLGVPVPRPVRLCVIENEGPPFLFQQKLAAKAESWDGPDFRDNVFVFSGPWGEFTFAESECREALIALCEQHEIDVVVANPTLGLGVAASGRPDETQQFVDLLVECGLKSERAFWLLHHENKAHQISGDWGRHPDTKVHLQQDGDKQRTRLSWEKTRWATLPTCEVPKACILEWILETQGYTVVDLEVQGASGDELKKRLIEFLEVNPMSSTRATLTGVKGTNGRLRSLLDDDEFDCVEGTRGATLWFLRGTATDSADTVADAYDGNPHE